MAQYLSSKLLHPKGEQREESLSLQQILLWSKRSDSARFFYEILVGFSNVVYEVTFFGLPSHYEFNLIWSRVMTMKVLQSFELVLIVVWYLCCFVLGEFLNRNIATDNHDFRSQYGSCIAMIWNRKSILI